MQPIKHDALHYLLLLISALDQLGSELYNTEVVTLEGNFVVTRNATISLNTTLKSIMNFKDR